MYIATHLIKIKGKIDKNVWTKETLKDYVKSKIDRDIQSFYHTDLELFGIDGDVVDVWVFVSTLSSNVSKDIICKWLDNHIKEDGITVTCLEIEEIFDLSHPIDTFVTFLQ